MQIRELVELGRYLSDALEKGNLVNVYQQLIGAINQAAQNQRPNKVQSHLKQLRKIHEQAQAEILSPAQAKLLADYGADKLLGASALLRIDQILKENQAHPQGLATAFSQLKDETSELASKATQLVSVLAPLFETLEESATDLAEDEGRLWLYFSDNVAVESINDLESAAETWKQVLHNFSRLPGATADGGRILTIQKRSPLELELAAQLALLTPLALSITWVLKRMEHVIKILQEVEALKQLKVKTKIIKDLQAEAEAERRKIAEEAADRIKEEFNADNETRNAVQQALSKVIKFIEGGGQLDIDTDSGSPENQEEAAPEEAREKGQIKALITVIRQEMKALPAPPSDGTDEKDEKDG